MENSPMELAQRFPKARELMTRLANRELDPLKLETHQAALLLEFKTHDEIQFKLMERDLTQSVTRDLRAALRQAKRSQAEADTNAAKVLRLVEAEVPAETQTYTIGNHRCPQPPDVTVAGGVLMHGEELDRMAEGLIGVAEVFEERTEQSSGAISVRVAWEHRGRTRSAILGTGQVLSSRKLVETLSPVCPLVHSENAKHLVKLFAHQIANLDPSGTFARKCGWADGGFACPTWTQVELEQPHAVEVAPLPSDNVATLSDGYRRKGTWEGYLQALDLLPNHPAAWAALYASVASPLLTPAEVNVGAFVSLVGQSGCGKTQLLRLAAASWGDPGRLALSFDSTLAGLEKSAAFASGTALCLDETQVASSVGSDAGVVNSVVYAIANGRSRNRKTESATTFSVIALATGERSLHSFGLKEGSQNRVLEMSLRPGERYFFETRSQCDRIKSLINQNYGHLGPRVAEVVAGMSWADVAGSISERAERFNLESTGGSTRWLCCS
jgi:hypothetical protein